MGPAENPFVWMWVNGAEETKASSASLLPVIPSVLRREGYRMVPCTVLRYTRCSGGLR